jgi:hypothetical protein
MKSVGLPTQTSKKPFLGYRKPVFSDIFCPLGGFFLRRFFKGFILPQLLTLDPFINNAHIIAMSCR